MPASPTPGGGHDDYDDDGSFLWSVGHLAAKALPRIRDTCSSGWRQFVRVANPKILQNEILTPEEMQLQAKFESIDYHKPYPTMYMRHLREKYHEEIRRNLIVPPGAGATLVGSKSDGESAAADSASTGEWLLNEGSSTARNAATAILEEVTAYDASSKNSTLRWILHVLIGIAVGCIAFLVSYMVGTLEDWRSDKLYSIVVDRESRGLGYFLGFLFWIVSSMALVAVAAAVIVLFEPAAGGSGIPDVIAYLNGVLIPKVMNFRTFVAKTVSCICAVGGGLPVGVEAPLIHLGAIAGAGVTQGRSRTLGCQTRLFQAFRNNKDRRDFITAGAACGVSAAFGAPIGGLLFVMEEVSSFWDYSSSGQVFLASMIAYSLITIFNSITNTIGRGYVASSDSLLFEVNVSIPLNLTAIVPSSFLGILCGLLAVVFTKMNLIVIRFRRANIKPHKMRRLLEPILIGIVFSAIMYLLALMPSCVPTRAPGTYNETTDVQPWQTENVSLLVNLTCHEPDTYSPLATLTLGMGKSTIRHMFTRRTVEEFPAGIVFVYLIVYAVFACYTSGTFVASGLVVPTLVIGSTFGRLFGLFIVHAFAKNTNIPGGSYFASESWMDPGVFALIGAGAFFGGISRMTMSISVIMVELSGELHFLLPIMVAIVLAKTVADWLSEPLYHQQLHLDFVPYLPMGIAKEFEQLTAADVMKRDVVTLRMRERTSVILAALQSSTHHAFPVVSVTVDEQGRQRERFVGIATREDIHVYLSLPSLQHYAANSELSRNNSGPSTSFLPSSEPAVPGDVFAAAGVGRSGDVADASMSTPVAAGSLPASSSVAARTHSHPGTADDDGFGGQLPPAVTRINHMSWTDWMTHQTSLFFVIGSKKWHQSWGTAQGLGNAAASSDSTGSSAVHVKSRGVTSGGMLPPVVDLSLIVNRSPWVVPPYFNLSMTYSSFRSMGLRHLVVIDGDDVQGIITRKELLVNTLKQRLQELHGRSSAAARQPHVLPSSASSHSSREAADMGLPASMLLGSRPLASSMPQPDCSPGKKQRLLGPIGSSDEE
jgi:H+/Cl- antiporter ClcA